MVSIVRLRVYEAGAFCRINLGVDRWAEAN